MTNPKRHPESPADDFNARMDRIARMQEENAIQLAETRRLIKELGKEVRGISGSNGECFEDEVSRAVRDAKGIADIKLQAITDDLCSFRGNQFDIVGVNGKCVVLMEVKITLGSNDIVHFVDESMPAFKQDFAADIGRKSVKGALIYRRIGGRKDTRRKVAAEALAHGIILMRAVGNNTLYQIKTPEEVSIPARKLQTTGNNARAAA